MTLRAIPAIISSSGSPYRFHFAARVIFRRGCEKLRRDVQFQVGEALACAYLQILDVDALIPGR